MDIARQPHMMRTSSAHLKSKVISIEAVARKGRRDDAGQVAVEWLMVAGILTAVAIFLSMMFKPVLIDMVRLLARAVRTPGL